jgi:hypothetical protein
MAVTEPSAALGWASTPRVALRQKQIPVVVAVEAAVPQEAPSSLVAAAVLGAMWST